MHVQIKYSLALLQDLISTLGSIRYIVMQNTDKVEIKSCTCAENAIL